MNTTAVGFLIDADQEDGADLKREETEAVHVAPEGGVVDAFDALGVQHRVLAGWQAHVLRERADQLLDGDGLGAAGDEPRFGGGRRRRDGG